MRYTIKIGWFFVGFFFVLSGTVCWGVDFRIENQVFLEGKAEPQSQSLTLFREGMAYDFLSEPSEVTIFDKATGRFILLNNTAKIQTELTITEVELFIEKLKKMAGRQSDPLSKFYADPHFQEQFESAAGDFVLTSPWVTYRVVTRPVENPTISTQYREFSDWYARLNTMLNPGSRPPLPRLLVNEALARRSVLAKEVRLTLVPQADRSDQKVTLRSEHEFAERLTSADLQKIEQVQQSRGKFRVVSFEEYEKSRKPAK